LWLFVRQLPYCMTCKQVLYPVESSNSTNPLTQAHESTMPSPKCEHFKQIWKVAWRERRQPITKITSPQKKSSKSNGLKWGLSSKASTHCVCPCTFCWYLLKRLLPSPFYSFILSLVPFGLKLSGGILLTAEALGWAGLYTPPLDFMRL
jgi:hypothetical protein